MASIIGNDAWIPFLLTSFDKSDVINFNTPVKMSAEQNSSGFQKKHVSIFK